MDIQTKRDLLKRAFMNNPDQLRVRIDHSDPSFKKLNINFYAGLYDFDVGYHITLDKITKKYYIVFPLLGTFSQTTIQFKTNSKIQQEMVELLKNNPNLLDKLIEDWLTDYYSFGKNNEIIRKYIKVNEPFNLIEKELFNKYIETGKK